MRLRRLGGSAISISAVGLGGYELGPEEGEQPAVGRGIAVVEAALAAGVNWLDTAEAYHDTRNESLFGDVLRRVDGEMLVATKVWPAPSGSGYRREEIRAACQASLRRLGRERLDVYFLHRPDDTGVPLEETWGAMGELVEAGLVGAIGLSNYPLADVEACHAQRPVDVVQDGLSMIDHLDLRDALARCGELGIGAMVYEPLAGGVLSDKTADQVLAVWWEYVEAPVYQRLYAPGRVERSFAVADGMRPLAQRRGVSVAELAIAWVLHQPGVTAAIVGSRSGAHMSENADAADLDLTAGLAELEALIPLGPAFAATAH